MKIGIIIIIIIILEKKCYWNYNMLKFFLRSVSNAFLKKLIGWFQGFSENTSLAKVFLRKLSGFSLGFCF